MTTRNMLRIAMEQSAEDIGCDAEDFLLDRSIVVPFRLGSKAKKYYKPPIGCSFISYGNNVVASSADALFDIVTEYVGRFDFYHCFETPNMHWLNQNLEPLGQTVCFMAEYYLPDLSKLMKIPCQYEIRLLEKDDFEDLYLPEWSNALCCDRKHLDVLGVGAYDDGKLIGLAGCSADAEDMWQIGVDVLPEYRKKGTASAITSRLAAEIIDRDKVPFYCSAWSNIRSVRNAIKSGFVPAWAEMTVKPVSVVEKLNLFSSERKKEMKEFERSEPYDDMNPVGYTVTGESIPKRVEGPLWDNVDELGLSVRTYYRLKHAGINTVEDLCNRTLEDMMNIPNLGRRCLEEILAGLKENGLSLKDSEDE